MLDSRCVYSISSVGSIVLMLDFLSTLTGNIRTRRGSKVAINLPIFFDEKTPRPFVDPTIPWDRSIYPEDHGKLFFIHNFKFVGLTYE